MAEPPRKQNVGWEISKGSESDNNGNREVARLTSNLSLKLGNLARDGSNHILGPGLNPNAGKDECD